MSSTDQPPNDPPTGSVIELSADDADDVSGF